MERDILMPMKSHKLLPFVVFGAFIILFLGQQVLNREIFVTPDFGRSDLLNLTIPLKQFLQNNLHQGEFPLWNPYIGNGIPQLAESQTGALQPINIILFGLLPMDFAFNLSYIIIFATTFFSTYFYLKTIKCSNFSSTVSALAFTFSAIFIVHLTHFNLIQSLSFFPLMLFIVEKSLQTKRKRILLFSSVVFSLSFLSGFFQTTLYTIVFLFLYIFFRFAFGQKFKTGEFFAFIFTFIFSLFLGLLLSAAQLLPSIEYLNISSKIKSDRGMFSELQRFPYVVKNFLEFLNPYINGDPRLGTYPPFGNNWGIFWENAGYFGIASLFFSFLGLMAWRKNRFVRLFFIIALILIVLILGKNSPAFVLFEFPPLSLFRVPARFLVFLTFSLVVLCAIGISKFEGKFKRRKHLLIFISTIILAAVFLDLLFFARNYSLVGVEKDWISCPATGTKIKEDSGIFRIYTYGNPRLWSEVFTKVGWMGKEKEYYSLRNGLDVYFSEICPLSDPEDYHVSLTVPRQRILIDTIGSGIAFSNNDIIRMSTPSSSLLGLSNVKYIVSPYPIAGDDMEVFATVSAQPYTYNIYKNNKFIPRAILVPETEKISTVDDFFSKVGEKSFDFRKVALVEDDTKITDGDSGGKVDIISYKNQEVKIKVSNKKAGVLILFDNYYPGWKVYVNGKEQKIIKADFAFRGVILQPGENTVVFQYKPTYWKVGVIVSVITLIFVVFLLRKVILSERTKRSLSEP